MLGDKVKVIVDGHVVTVENLCDYELTNCFIDIKNIFYLSLLNFKLNLKPYEKIPFNIFEYYDFLEFYNGQKIYVKIFSNHELIFQKEFNDKTKCFVLISNKNYEKITEQIIIGLRRYSNVDILHYTINYKSNLEYDYLQNVEFSLRGDSNDPQYMQFSKPSVFLNVLEKGYLNAVFLDSDMQVKSNIEKVFNYISEIEEGPILHKACWNFTVANNLAIPGPLLSEEMNLPPQKAPQGVTNIVIFSQKHYSLFKEWEKICFSDNINRIRKVEFLHDELILNCLMWKLGVRVKLFYLSLNVTNDIDVNFFYNYENLDYNNEVNMNDYDLGHPFQSTFPYDKSEVLAFHCIKDHEMAKKVNDIILKMESDKKTVIEKDIYDNLTINKNIIQDDGVIVNYNFIDGAFVEIVGGEEGKKYKIKFLDENNVLHYEADLTSGMWCRTSKRFLVNWRIEVSEGQNIIFKHDFNPEGKRIYVALDSKSLGDNLAWVPYLEEFRKKYKCKLVTSTFFNHLFKEKYPEIEFVTPGEVVTSLYAMFMIGWYYNKNGQINSNKNPHNFRNQSLQKTATDILGLEYREIKPLINFKPSTRPIEKKYFCIANHSTAQSKYWNNPTGWQELVDYLKSEGYEVILLSKEPDNYMGNKNPKGVIKLNDKTLEEIANYLYHSEGFIGLGSGLSWLSWALGVKTVLISGFSRPISEMRDCIRIFVSDDKKVCNGCFNDYRLDPGDWNWCPLHKGTDRQFECTKSITGEMVINQLKSVLN